MRIHGDFLGGNIVVKEQTGQAVYLENDLRGTEGDWFYWAFCVEGAAGQTLHFQLQPNRVGYYGPAVSHDLSTWHWLMDKTGENAFSYTFGEEENRVYFAHHVLYHPARFFAFADRLKIPHHTLCRSRKGRRVPCLTFGSGETSLLLTARHHACESTGSYVLEGVLEELWLRPIEGIRVFCVPFVDYDGVIEGDQGKNRAPHDHFRDYAPNAAALYPATQAVRDYVATHKVRFGFDFHSPAHCGGEHDTCFMVQASEAKLPELNRFAACFASCITPEAFRYDPANDLKPNFSWNVSAGDDFADMIMARPEAEFGIPLETAYFGKPDTVFTAEKGVETGRCFARAIKKYMQPGSRV